MNAAPVPVLWLYSPLTTGKSAVAYELFTQVRQSGRKAAYVDLGQLGFCHPPTADGPHNHRTKAANLGAIWPTFREAGARCLILYGDVENPGTVALYRAALPPAAFTLYRLSAAHDRPTDTNAIGELATRIRTELAWPNM